MTIRELGPTASRTDLHVTERPWTLISPWDVATSPVEGDILDVLTFARREDAEQCVREHNMLLRHTKVQVFIDAHADLIDRVYDRERDRRAGL